MYDEQEDWLDDFIGMSHTMLEQVKQLDSDNYKIKFIDRLTKLYQDELGLSQEDAYKAAFSFDYSVEESFTYASNYPEAERKFFDVLVAMFQRIRELYPHLDDSVLVSFLYTNISMSMKMG